MTNEMVILLISFNIHLHVILSSTGMTSFMHIFPLLVPYNSFYMGNNKNHSSVNTFGIK